MEKVQLDILGLFANKPPQTATFTLLLGEVSGDRRLPIMIGVPEAQAIALAIEGGPLDRPIMHDLFKQAIIKLGYTVQEVNITMLRDEMFFAQLSVTDGKEVIELNARPSDAIAIGLRFQAPLFIDETLLNEAGGVLTMRSWEKLKEGEGYQDIGLVLEQKPKQKAGNKEQLTGHSVEALKKLLDMAISKEDYEQAAIIRDELKRRKE